MTERFHPETRSVMKNITMYYDIKKAESRLAFQHQIARLAGETIEKKESILLVCIGSDRATGDSLGPLVGYKLKRAGVPHIDILGTLEHPVHAGNLSQIAEIIQKDFPRAFVIAVDASLGKKSHIGRVTFQRTSIKPGIGVGKILPAIGDVSITGIVNVSGGSSGQKLQSTRLHTVMDMADFICDGFIHGFAESGISYSVPSRLSV